MRSILALGMVLRSLKSPLTKTFSGAALNWTLGGPIKNVLQQHGCTLFRRQTHHQLFNRSANPKDRRIGRHYGIWAHCSSFSVHSNSTPPQEVDAPIVGDAEQPRPKRRLSSYCSSFR